MNLPERKTTSLELYGKNTGVIKAVNLRREMIKLPEVMNSLSVIDQGIFIATTTTRISDYSDNNLVQALNVLTKFIGKDLGIKGEIEPYEQTRFLEILKKYYSDLTVQEVKISFELSLTGELDEFLPSNSLFYLNICYYPNLPASSHRRSETMCGAISIHQFIQLCAQDAIPALLEFDDHTCVCR